ncbi:MAG: RNA polymerase sigma factor [Parasporobacterium sp.]|nr:RNA polymerase sigma factor [Parasporobacterium sp.]
MTQKQFEQFIMTSGKDILRFCRMTAWDEDMGNDLYQDVMLRLSEKRHKLDAAQNIKSYALSMCILLWKNRKRKHAVRMRLAPTGSLDELNEEGVQSTDMSSHEGPEDILVSREQNETVRRLVASLDEKYRLPLYLHYCADLKINEIAGVLNIPENTVKSRMHTARTILKKKLEELGYDR